ncbi:hypothetical protein OESDEN_20698 [Oesophagostomum dentatum]|uniref:Poly(A) RNA polymerase mitochondrial-like central palm domain-containing protein n=1 Tax=Oesophagostomum dentatum TaxID=61180 RepID=A0A0B1S8Z3_OESDE|nr:hypothetical protein OESDEN_20698 [Oesophagostomum dentatum]
MLLPCSRLPSCSRRVVSTLSENPLIYDVDYRFSDSFIARHRKQLLQWNSSLVKAQGHRAQFAKKNRDKTDQYLSKLRNVLCNQRRSIVPIGSSVNGLCGKNSDLDLVLITDDNESRRLEYCEKFKNNEHFRRSQMNAVSGMLKSAKLVEPGSFQQILFSAVPILKFTTREGITVDLQFNNIGPIRSSLFVRTCVQFSIIVPIVLHWINSFFDTIKLKNSRHGLFSTYHLNMLALHFLQNRTFPVLPDILASCPRLQPNTPWQEVAEILSSRDAKVHILNDSFIPLDAAPAEVIIKMIDYFSQIDLYNLSIDICGNVYKRLPEDTEDSFIQLIDPYFPEDTLPHARCTVRNGPSLVQQAFSAMKSDLRSGIVPKFLRISRS